MKATALRGGGPGRAGALRGVVVLAAALAAAVAVVAAAVGAGPAEAAFPGPNGRIVFNQADGTQTNDYELYTVNPDGGGLIQLTDNESQDLAPSFSPDARSIVYNVFPQQEGDAGIYRLDLGADGRPTGPPTRIVASPNALFPSFSPDGREITYSDQNGQNGGWDVFRRDANGRGAATLVADVGQYDWYPVWSPRGDRIAFSGTFPFLSQEQSAVYVVPASGGQVEPITQPEEFAYGPDWSPNGRRIAYSAVGPEAQTFFDFEVFSRPAGGGERARVTDDPATFDVFPAYSPEGDQISYRGLLLGQASQPTSRAAATFGVQASDAPLDAQDLLALGAGSDEIGTLGRNDTSAVYRVPSGGGAERGIPGTGSSSDNIFFDILFPGPDWGEKTAASGGGRLPCTIKGTRRGDSIVGTEGRDVICAGGGSDSVHALGGDDVVYGGPGNDAIYGEDGDDDLYGERGDDSLVGGPGQDDLFGGPGRDSTVQ